MVGSVNVLFDDDFEGAGDGGWTHGTYGDTPNPHDDFQRGTPAGLAGDPSGAASGANAWGNDLGLGGAWNGAYQGGQHDWLRSPARIYPGCDGASPSAVSTASISTVTWSRWRGPACAPPPP